MRISDWSSDVCSSDLNARALERQTAFTRGVGQSLHPPVKEITTAVEHDLLDAGRHGALGHQLADLGSRGLVGAVLQLRSEEHTSELQSLMRISYAVFCLKKKKQTNKIISEQKQQN